MNVIDLSWIFDKRFSKLINMHPNSKNSDKDPEDKFATVDWVSSNMP